MHRPNQQFLTGEAGAAFSWLSSPDRTGRWRCWSLLPGQTASGERAFRWLWEISGPYPRAPAPSVRSQGILGMWRRRGDGAGPPSSVGRPGGTGAGCPARMQPLPGRPAGLTAEARSCLRATPHALRKSRTWQLSLAPPQQTQALLGARFWSSGRHVRLCGSRLPPTSTPQIRGATFIAAT